jgi:hypothetical protein
VPAGSVGEKSRGKSEENPWNFEDFLMYMEETWRIMEVSGVFP